MIMGDDGDEVGGWGDDCECLDDRAVDQTPLQVMMQTNKECKYDSCTGKKFQSELLILDTLYANA